MTRKVWVEVECENGQPGETRPRLVGGIDPERARQAFLALVAYEPGDGPGELFNDGNAMYSPRRSLATVLTDDYSVDAEAIIEEMRTEGYARVEARAARATPEYLAEREETRDQYIARWKRGTDDRLARAFREGRFDDVAIDAAASRVGKPAAEIRERMKGDEDVPFFTEAYLYTLLGKDHARSILAMMDRLREALGLGHVWEQRIEPCPTCGHVLT